MIADVIIKIVEKLCDSAMEKRDDEKIKLFEQNKMLKNRARLTSTDKLVISFIERQAPLHFDLLAQNFGHVDCLPKRVAMLSAFGFVTLNNNIINLDDNYKEIAREISANSMDSTLILIKPMED